MVNERDRVVLEAAQANDARPLDQVADVDQRVERCVAVESSAADTAARHIDRAGAAKRDGVIVGPQITKATDQHCSVVDEATRQKHLALFAALAAANVDHAVVEGRHSGVVDNELDGIDRQCRTGGDLKAVDVIIVLALHIHGNTGDDRDIVRWPRIAAGGLPVDGPVEVVEVLVGGACPDDVANRRRWLHLLGDDDAVTALRQPEVDVGVRAFDAQCRDGAFAGEQGQHAALE